MCIYNQNVLWKEKQEPTYEPYMRLNSARIKLIDFGGACFREDRDNYTINTRQYRAPEVVLACCRWDTASDVWSLGCLLMELYTGELFFPTHNDLEHVMMMQKACGEFPKWMVNQSNEKMYEYWNERRGQFVADKHPKSASIERNLQNFESFQVKL